MKYIINVAVLILIFLFSSCGPSAEEIAAQQKRRDDSIVVATQRIQQEKQNLKSEFSSIKNEYQHAVADFVAAKDEMNHVRDFHFGRLQSDRDEQIRNQALKIQHIGDRVDSLKLVMNEKQNALAAYK